MKNIGFVHMVFNSGGTEIATLNLCNYLKQNGYNVFIFTKNINKEFFQSNIQAINVIKVSKRKKVSFIEEIKKNKLELLIFTSVSCDISPKKQREISEKSGVKHVCIDHGRPFWEATNKLQRIKRKIQTRSFFSRLKYKILLKFHNQSKEDRKIKGYYKFLLTHADSLVVLCQEYAETILKELQMQSDKIIAIPNALPPVSIDYNLDKKNIILYVGRVEYSDKRVDRLIEIWKQIYKDYPDWELQIVGEGSDKAFLEQNVEKEQLERITFFKATPTPYTFYNEASILCITSQSESWGLVLTEAQQAGVIPMAFECSEGVSKILSPSSENGILVPCYDMEKYKNELRTLIENEQKRKYIQANILQKSKEYDVNSIGNQWDMLFRKLLDF
ncbi:glycosyltransferase [Capnocytophaga canimorsus]|uniref:glycosyltransferase n=1 Tax=Capnocytophaga canimorsus TaxID=28188 RepID=UPI001AD5D831|nr:glycosyltransferase [Capnocytophaga canimorsus]GIM58849.1 hypothetical protein CAPN007_10570 [Capnocytophaga canimorsus]